MGLMSGKRGLITGLLNTRSITWGIAQQLKEEGAEIALTYSDLGGEKRIKEVADKLGSTILIKYSPADDDSIANVFKVLEKEWGSIDFVVHGAAYSDKEQLKGMYYDTTRDNFKQCMSISCFSFVSMAKYAMPLMEKAGGGSLLTLSYYGAEKVITNYNVMGVAKAALEASVRYLAKDMGEKNIRVNAISSGPVKTLAASAIGGFNYMLKFNELNSPLKSNVTPEDNGKTALYLLSDLSSGMSGQVIHLDSGFSVIGMKDPKTPNIELPEGL